MATPEKTSRAVAFPPLAARVANSARLIASRLAAKGPRLIAASILLLSASLIAFPLVWTMLTAFKSPVEITRIPPSLLPEAPTFSNFLEVFRRQAFGRYLYNSTLFAALSTGISVLVASLAGFGFAKFQFPLKDVLFFAIIGLLMVPFQVLLIPLFLTTARLGWLNSYQGLLLPFAVSAFGVFVMRNAIEQVPNDYLDAARIDGASDWTIFWKVILPMVRSSIATVAIVKFLWTWNEFLWPLVVTNKTQMYVVTVGLQAFSNIYFNEYHLLTAAAVMSIIPIVVVFIVFQKWIVRALVMSGLKG